MEVKRQLVFESLQTIQPNKMQLRAMENLNRLREHGESKALVIAATGTGDTVEYNGEKPITMKIKLHNEVPSKIYREFIQKV